MAEYTLNSVGARVEPSKGWELAEDIATRVRELREALELTQPEFGGLFGVTDQTVSNWERGNFRPPRSKLEWAASRQGWPVTIFQERGPRPQEVVVSGRPALHGESELPPPQLAADEAPQLDNAEILRLVLYDRPGFVRFLQRRVGSQPIPTNAKLGFLDFVEEIARERGQTIPKEFFAHLRGLIREHGL